ncbi:MAG: hypothetical protein BWK78_03100 [Thiotrichaceae bacterium IS1]|nr:MAG: hypothetical protein BWK78_03100 [Thiotrichaceae bacterium IS1]
MSALPAARVSDIHECSTPTPSPHVGGPINPPCSPTVLTNNLAQARATDQLTCTGSPATPNFIVTGSSTVLINGKMAARETDKTMHPPPGKIITGSSNVLIGGPTAGATLGNTKDGEKACQDAAPGRKSSPKRDPKRPPTGQSYNNCGIESARQIINQANRNQKNWTSVDEYGLFNFAISKGYATKDPNNHPRKSGGTNPADRNSILNNYGVPSTLQSNSMENIMQSVAEGKGVITSHDAVVLWGPKAPPGGHAITVIGVEYDANGNPINVIVNDTGTGECGKKYPIATFQNSLRSGRDINVTTNPIW